MPSQNKPEESQVITFNFQRSTKNTHVFVEEAEEGQEKVGSLYMKKSAFKTQPQMLTVTVVPTF